MREINGGNQNEYSALMGLLWRVMDGMMMYGSYYGLELGGVEGWNFGYWAIPMIRR